MITLYIVNILILILVINSYLLNNRNNIYYYTNNNRNKINIFIKTKLNDKIHLSGGSFRHSYKSKLLDYYTKVKVKCYLDITGKYVIKNKKINFENIKDDKIVIVGDHKVILFYNKMPRLLKLYHKIFNVRINYKILDFTND